MMMMIMMFLQGGGQQISKTAGVPLSDFLMQLEDYNPTVSHDYIIYYGVYSIGGLMLPSNSSRRQVTLVFLEGGTVSWHTVEESVSIPFTNK